MSCEYQQIPIEKLIPYARNARTHSDEQVAQIAASIREFGFLAPVVISADHGILAGHGRVLAARKLGLETVPCVRADHLTENQRRAYVLADNQLALNSSWDDSMLAVELEALSGEMDMTEFGLEALIDGAAGTDDEPPESSTKEIDPDEYEMGHRCPRCGFEFDAEA
jgi:ParB-like chromosome segregation protein Spo0J